MLLRRATDDLDFAIELFYKPGGPKAATVSPWVWPSQREFFNFMSPSWQSRLDIRCPCQKGEFRRGGVRQTAVPGPVILIAL